MLIKIHHNSHKTYRNKIGTAAEKEGFYLNKKKFVSPQDILKVAFMVTYTLKKKKIEILSIFTAKKRELAQLMNNSINIYQNSYATQTNLMLTHQIGFYVC